MNPLYLEAIALNEERALIERLKTVNRCVAKAQQRGSISSGFYRKWIEWVDFICEEYCQVWDDLPSSPEPSYREYYIG